MKRTVRKELVVRTESIINIKAEDGLREIFRLLIAQEMRAELEPTKT
jgi:hypothetical protein